MNIHFKFQYVKMINVLHYCVEYHNPANISVYICAVVIYRSV